MKPSFEKKAQKIASQKTPIAVAYALEKAQQRQERQREKTAGSAAGDAAISGAFAAGTYGLGSVKLSNFIVMEDKRYLLKDAFEECVGEKVRPIIEATPEDRHKMLNDCIESTASKNPDGLTTVTILALTSACFTLAGVASVGIALYRLQANRSTKKSLSILSRAKAIQNETLQLKAV